MRSKNMCEICYEYHRDIRNIVEDIARLEANQPLDAVDSIVFTHEREVLDSQLNAAETAYLIHKRRLHYDDGFLLTLDDPTSWTPTLGNSEKVTEITATSDRTATLS
jgi:hypothetical protein